MKLKMPIEDSLSVLIPALNEEGNLEATVSTVSAAVKKWFADYEIIIFNDGSTDKTSQIADRLVNQYSYVRVIHHRVSTCLGGIYKEGIKLAKMHYVILVNGKNDISENELDKILRLKGQADMIIPHPINAQQRPITRKMFSKSFVWVLNAIFKLNLRYYNHYVLHNRKIVNSIYIQTNSYAFQAEALIKLIKSGHNYTQVGVIDNFKNDIKTKAFSLKNIMGVNLFLIRMIYEIYFKSHRKSL